MVQFNVEFVRGKNVTAWLEAMPARVHDELHRTVQRLVIKLLGIVQREKLQGQVLGHRSGRLSRSIEQKVTDEPDSIVGRVFSNATVKYAAIHEYGFNGPESVRAHTRKITQAFGNPITPRDVMVAQFTRNMKMPERSFLRSTLNENADMIIAALKAGAARGAKAQGEATSGDS